MQSTRPTTKNDSAHRIREKYYFLGTDATGGTHVYRTSDETVFSMTAAGEIETRFDLEAIEKSADEYVAFIADRRGWADQQFGIGAILDQLPAPGAV